MTHVRVMRLRGSMRQLVLGKLSVEFAAERIRHDGLTTAGHDSSARDRRYVCYDLTVALS